MAVRSAMGRTGPPAPCPEADDGFLCPLADLPKVSYGSILAAGIGPESRPSLPSLPTFRPSEPPLGANQAEQQFYPMPHHIPAPVAGRRADITTRLRLGAAGMLLVLRRRSPCLHPP